MGENMRGYQATTVKAVAPLNIRGIGKSSNFLN